MMKDRLIVMVWSIEDGWAFVALDSKAKVGLSTFEQIVGGGNLVSCKTIDELVTTLKKAGWVRATPQDIPGIVWASTQAAASWLVSQAGNFTTFVFVPADAGVDFLDMLGITGYEDL